MHRLISDFIRLKKLPQSLTAVMLLSMGSIVEAQVFPQINPRGDNVPDLTYDEGGEFNFVRVQFDTYYGQGFGFGTWSIDFPDADMNFLRGVSRLTNIRVMSEPIVLRIDDEGIFDYPFLYMLEVGQAGGLVLDPAETENLKEYLLRGGFLLIDDFGDSGIGTFFSPHFHRFFPIEKLSN